MINEFVYCINMIIGVFGFLSCLFILTNPTLNKQTAGHVCKTCLAGFCWFFVLYSSFLQLYVPNGLLMLELFFLFLIFIWVRKGDKEKHIWLMMD